MPVVLPPPLALPIEASSTVAVPASISMPYPLLPPPEVMPIMLRTVLTAARLANRERARRVDADAAAADRRRNVRRVAIVLDSGRCARSDRDAALQPLPVIESPATTTAPASTSIPIGVPVVGVVIESSVLVRTVPVDVEFTLIAVTSLTQSLLVTATGWATAPEIAKPMVLFSIVSLPDVVVPSIVTLPPSTLMPVELAALPPSMVEPVIVVEPPWASTPVAQLVASVVSTARVSAWARRARRSWRFRPSNR